MMELAARDLMAFHDGRHATAGWAKSGAAEHRVGVWQAIEDNHRFNCLLWDEEDQARRRNVPDSDIAGNKRAIDGYNRSAMTPSNVLMSACWPCFRMRRRIRD